MNALCQVATSYRQKYHWSSEDVQIGLVEAAGGYITRNAKAFGDGIAVTVALEALLAGNEVDLDNLSDPAREAFQEAFPNVSIESLESTSPEKIEYLLNAWKGKLFEVDVRDRLNQGEWVGDWHLEAGQTAQLAESATQPGWDLSIHNEDGSVTDIVQLKATDSAAYIRDSLERYPDIPILATGDVSIVADQLSSVSSDTVTAQELSEQITNAVPVDAGHDVADSLGMMAPASLIALTEGYQVWTGKKSADEAMESSGERLMMAGAAAAAGAVATVLTGGLFGAIVAIGTRIYLGSKVQGKSNFRRTESAEAITDSITIEGEATRVDESNARKSGGKRKKSGFDHFKNLENVNGYLGPKYLPGPST